MRCSACGYESPTAALKLKCPKCKRLGTLKRWAPLSSLAAGAVQRLSTPFPLLDALLDGGCVRGAAYRLSGPPGCGKSTLALLLAAHVRGLYLTSEETEGGLKVRAERLGLGGADLPVGQLTNVDHLIPAELPKLDLLVVDSINELCSPSVSGTAGGNDQLIHATRKLRLLAQSLNLVVLMISQVNKEGEAAGARAADHIPDGTLEMVMGEDGRGLLRIRKHRYGPAPAAIGYQHTDTGLEFFLPNHEVDDEKNETGAESDPGPNETHQECQGDHAGWHPAQQPGHRGGHQSQPDQNDDDEEEGDEEEGDEEEGDEEEGDEEEDQKSAPQAKSLRSIPLKRRR